MVNWSGILTCMLFMTACLNPSPGPVDASAAGAQEQVYSTEIFLLKDSLYGYRIFQSGELLIEQKNIPAREGNLGFPDSISAARTAAFVVSKLEKGIFPPTLSAQETDSLLKQP